MSAARLDDKAFATLRAKAALQGVQLIRSANDIGRETFIVSKWSMCREMASADEVEDLLQRMAGERAE